MSLRGVGQSSITILQRPPVRLMLGIAAIAAIAVADLELNRAVPLALLYLLPVVGMSSALRRWQIPLLGLLCTAVAEFSDAFPWTLSEGIPRDALYFFAYTAAGLYVSEALSRRRAEQVHVAALEREIEVRVGVEEQLRLVVANSSIAIVTTNEQGDILQTNDAAERLYSSESEPSDGHLVGQPLKTFLPSLARVPIRKQGWEALRTMMQCEGLRANHEPFLADVWFSTYLTSSGARLTAMIVDSSVETHEREQANLEQVLVGSRLAMGALLHEIRNICAAISIVHQNLIMAPEAHIPKEDFEALGQLVSALERMASAEVALVKREATSLSLDNFFRDLYMIVTPSVRESGIHLTWNIDHLPDVVADAQSLLQVFLNLIRNAEKALASVTDAHLQVDAIRKGSVIQIALSDNGPGVANPDQLFKPFGRTNGTSGLGLYLSRAMMLSFNGDLHFQPSTNGATFVVELVIAGTEA